MKKILCGYGGIGRHAGFRFLWETVQVRVLLSAPFRKSTPSGVLFLNHTMSQDSNLRRHGREASQSRLQTDRSYFIIIITYVLRNERWIMAKICIFCGEEIAVFRGKKLECDGYMEDVCEDCFDKYHELHGVELAQKILATGRANNVVGIREYIKNTTKHEQERLEREKKKHEEFCARHPETGKCPKCGGPMHQYGPVAFKLGDETIFFSDFNRLMTGSLSVRLDRCRECGYTEFYTPNVNEIKYL